MGQIRERSKLALEAIERVRIQLREALEREPRPALAVVHLEDLAESTLAEGPHYLKAIDEHLVDVTLALPLRCHA
jgi:hypothetical protein